MAHDTAPLSCLFLPFLLLTIAQTCSHGDHHFCHIHQNSHLQSASCMLIIEEIEIKLFKQNLSLFS